MKVKRTREAISSRFTFSATNHDAVSAWGCTSACFRTFSYYSRARGSMTQALRFTGVPEAFNIPLKNCQNVRFIEAPGGTGAMLDALRSDQPTADVSIVLTECVVSAIENGGPFRILGPYVQFCLDDF